VYDTNGVYQGALEDTTGAQIVNHGLWGLSFGKPAGSTASQRLYFAAGVADETHGLFGYIALADSDSTGGGGPPVACENHAKDVDFWQKQCGGKHGGEGDDGDDDDQGEDDFVAHHDRGGAPSDSLDVLFAAIANAPAPNAFGSEGCFTAGCDLLRHKGRGNNSESAAQVLLVTRLNLGVGSLCDSLVISCRKSNGLTVGEAADSLDVLLCNNGDRKDIKNLTDALRCAVDGEDEGADQGEDEDGGRHHNVVATVGANPARLGESVRFQLSATTPATVQLRIYDVRGRLVAEPMRGSLVSGSASATWDGTDLRGRAVAPGTYFYRTVSAGETTTGRFLIIR
jgi:hypothetical protein